MTLAEAALALAMEAHAVEAQRIDDVRPTVDVRQHLHPKQLEVFECDAPAMEILGGRQGGKTFVDVGWQIEGALEKPGTVNPYFGLTRESVTDIWWPEVEAWWALLGWDTSLLHEHSKIAIIPNGSKLKGRGTDDKRTIETARGAKYNRIVIDEMGAQDEQFIRYFVNLLWPTMIKNNGRMIRSGNPGLILDGYWFQHTNDHRQVHSPLFHWTAWDNPALGDHAHVDAFVSKQLEDDCGMTLDQIRDVLSSSGDEKEEERRAELRKSGPVVTFLREWKAQWVADQGTLVYPFDLRRNGVDALPTHNRNGVALDVKLWRHTAVCDPAGKGYTGFALFASHPHLKRRYLVSSEKHRGMLLGEAANRLRAYRTAHPGCRLGLDAGGLGSVHSQQFAREFALWVEDAKKTEKASAIAFFRNNLIAGAIGVVNGEQNDAWRGEAAACGWDRTKLLHDPEAEDHCLDSALYCERLDKTRPQEDKSDEVPPPSDIELAAAMKARRMKQIAQSERRGGGWR